jgi:hypothetical protein
VGSNKLSDLLLQPYDLLKPGWADSYLMGLVNQVQVIPGLVSDMLSGVNNVF